MTENFRPENHGTGIVHIGPGAFHRAHQASYAQDAMRASGGDWCIEGIAMRSTDVAKALEAQRGRYTLVERGESGSRFRVIEAVRKIHPVALDEGPAMDALVRPETRIVSLTITEKAYQETDQGDATALSLITRALSRRRETGLQPFTLLSCDNLSDNGAVLRSAVLNSAQRRDEDLAGWIAEYGCFPSTMVDRITPATKPSLIREIAEETGFSDQIPVETEVFSQWVIEDDFVDGRPDWEVAGALLVSNVAPYEKMKLRMLNGAHSMLAYTGHLMGKKYVRDVMADPELALLVDRHMASAAATLDTIPGVDFDEYRAALLSRFRNPHIAHETYQIAMDGSQKMPQRIFEPARTSLERGQDITAFAFATAAWLQYLSGLTDDGSAFALRDPREVELAKLPASPSERVSALCALPGLVPRELSESELFREAVVTNLTTMIKSGATAAVKEFSKR